MMPWDGNGNSSGWPYPLTIMGVILLLGLIVYAVVWLARPPAQQDRPAAGARSAEDLLAERFARGEIDELEYRLGIDVLQVGRTRAARR